MILNFHHTNFHIVLFSTIYIDCFRGSFMFVFLLGFRKERPSHTFCIFYLQIISLVLDKFSDLRWWQCCLDSLCFKVQQKSVIMLPVFKFQISIFLCLKTFASAIGQTLEILKLAFPQSICYLKLPLICQRHQAVKLKK